MKGGLMGQRLHTQLNGQTVTVKVVGIEQSIDSRHRGKWVCVNEATGRRLHRTERQLRLIPILPVPIEAVIEGNQECPTCGLLTSTITDIGHCGLRAEPFPDVPCLNRDA